MAATVYQWPEKAPDDIDTYGFDVSAWIEAGETVDEVDWSATDPEGELVPDMIESDDIAGNVVRVLVRDGEDETDYLFRALVTTSGGRCRTYLANLPVRTK